MKKPSLLNIIVIIGLLVLCVVTLIAIYATTPESSTVLLFEENFNSLDVNKWNRQTSECNEGDQFHYSKAGGENGNTLHVDQQTSNIEENFQKRIRDTSKNCQKLSCLNGSNSDENCIKWLHATNFQTKELFYVKFGRIEFRTKLSTEYWIKTTIKIIPNNTESDDRKEFNLLEANSEKRGNDSADVELFVIPIIRKSIMKSSTTADEFQTYKIEWKNDEIVFFTNSQEITKSNCSVNNFILNSTCCTKNTTIFSQPFYLNVDLVIGKKNFPNESLLFENNSSLPGIEDYNSKLQNASIMSIDYIRLYKILK